MLTQLLTANGNSDAVSFEGGGGTFFATNTFGGGSAKLQASLDGTGDWFDVKDAAGALLALTASGAFNFSIAACKLRSNLSGATVAGTAQVRTATAAGTVTGAGKAVLGFTSALINGGTQKVIFFDVAVGDTPTMWAAKARIALQDDAQLGQFFVFTVAGPSIITTSLGPVFFANDATRNLAIAPGTATGIVGAPTSAATTAGVASTVILTIKIAQR